MLPGTGLLAAAAFPAFNNGRVLTGDAVFILLLRNKSGAECMKIPFMRICRTSCRVSTCSFCSIPQNGRSRKMGLERSAACRSGEAAFFTLCTPRNRNWMRASGTAFQSTVSDRCVLCGKRSAGADEKSGGLPEKFPDSGRPVIDRRLALTSAA